MTNKVTTIIGRRSTRRTLFLKKVFWEQIASQRAPEIFFYVYAPSGDVGARRHALRAWAALLLT